MDDVVRDNLEDYLAGTLSGRAQAELEAYLRENPEAARELELYSKTSGLFEELRLPEGEEWMPGPGFSARVLRQIEEQQAAAPFWTAVFEPVFARRLAFACLMWFLLLGAYLISSGQPGMRADSHIAERILTEYPDERYQIRFGSDLRENRDSMLVALVEPAE